VTMERSQRLKTRLFEMDDNAIFLSRMEILKESADRYRDETAGIRFGHTLQAMLYRIDVVIDEDDLIVGRCPEVVPNAEEERWFREQFWPEIYSYHNNRVKFPHFPGHLVKHFPVQTALEFYTQ
jgi:hypothetical protein